MNKTRIGLLVAALVAAPALAQAQKAPAKGAAAAGAAEGATEGAAEGAAAEGAAAEGAATEGAEGADGAAAAEGAAAGGEGDEGGLAAICEIDPEACPKFKLEEEAKKPLNEHMYAVQQVYFLRSRRFELAPSWAVSMNDQFVTHQGPTLAANYYITNFWAVGLNGTYYEPFNNDSSFNFQLRRSARVSVPLNEYQWAGSLNVTYVPLAGKFSGFGDFIFHWDSYLVAGPTVISTRPIPVIDPDNRAFEFKMKYGGNLGLGIRIFMNRWIAVNAELRDYIFMEELENLDDGSGWSDADKLDEKNWYGDKQLTNNVMAQLGLSFFLPTSFEYRLPK